MHEGTLMMMMMTMMIVEEGLEDLHHLISRMLHLFQERVGKDVSYREPRLGTECHSALCKCAIYMQA